MIKKFLLTALLAFGVPAQAQLSTPGLSSSIKNMLNQMGTPAPAPATGTKPATPAKTVSLDFKPNAQVRQKAIKTFIDGFRTQAPQVAQELEAGFKKVDIFAEADKETRQKFGVSVNNTADMLAVYFSYVWLVARGDSGDATKAQVQGISRQLKTIFSSPGATPLTEVQKQETADALTLQTVFIGMITEAYKNEPDKLQEFGLALIESWKGQGFDLSQMELTDNGFVRTQ